MKKRAHTADGKFQRDDPSTPNINEAFVQPKKEIKMANKPTKASTARLDRSQAPRAPEPPEAIKAIRRAVGSGESAETKVVTNRHGIEVSTAK